MHTHHIQKTAEIIVKVKQDYLKMLNISCMKYSDRHMSQFIIRHTDPGAREQLSDELAVFELMSPPDIYSQRLSSLSASYYYTWRPSQILVSKFLWN